MKRHLLRLATLALLSLFLLLAGCRDQPADETPTATSEATAAPTATIPPVASPTILIPEATDTVPVPTDTPPPTVEVEQQPMPRFAEFRPAAVDVSPALVYDPVAPDLSNVLVPFPLSEEQLQRLAESGLVAAPGTELEFFTVYEKARYDNLPVFITSDSLLHSYHLIFDKVLRTAERDYFIPLLHELNAAMLAQTEAQYEALVGTEWEDAALRSVAFVGVGSRLLDPSVEIPAYAQELVDAEVALVEGAAGIQLSPLFPGLEFGEDYTQYIPRGHYTISEELTAYFKSMMWYGRMTFRLKTRDPEVGRAETRSALLLVQALRTATVADRPALDAWLDLYNPTAFLVGRSDDLTALQYLDVIDAVYGPEPSLAAITDDTKLDLFIEQADLLPSPQILGLVIAVDDPEVATTKGFRFMGQRFVPDAYIFRQLIYRNVGTNTEPRMLPMGLDVIAAMGSDRALTILTELGETDYQNYPSQMAKMQAWTASLTPADWTETVYNAWLYTFQPLLAEPTPGYPQFMLSDAWLDKQLNTSLGSWTELKHDTILYAKQVYAELGGGGFNPPQPRPAVGYVEPVPEFYARLSALAQMTYDGLLSRNLLSERDANTLQRLITLSNALQAMAEKELRGEPFTEEEASFIRFYGGELEHLVMASADSDDESSFAPPILDEEPQAAVVADVATAPDPDGDGVPNPVVLEEGVGRIDELYVVVPVIAADGTISLEVAKGGIFSYYEFHWPADDRLTDEAWRTMLDEGSAPDRPVWINSFFSPETAYAELQSAIYAFERSIPGFYWWPADDQYWPEAALAPFQADLDELAAAGQYAGREWLNADYRSFDLQSPELAVVTVRESWQDTLYDQQGEMPEETDPIIGLRGPYTLDVTFTVEKIDGVWQVTRVVLNSQPPAWQTP
ncbi:MAG: DUF3160 domain-containing protein [Anaerolineales bacterium]|nr:DUF3160 domain-containing protein [Anaerolineales bacterium]